MTAVTGDILPKFKNLTSMQKRKLEKPHKVALNCNQRNPEEF